MSITVVIAVPADEALATLDLLLFDEMIERLIDQGLLPNEPWLNCPETWRHLVSKYCQALS